MWTSRLFLIIRCLSLGVCLPLVPSRHAERRKEREWTRPPLKNQFSREIISIVKRSVYVDRRAVYTRQWELCRAKVRSVYPWIWMRYLRSRERRRWYFSLSLLAVKAISECILINEVAIKSWIARRICIRGSTEVVFEREESRRDGNDGVHLYARQGEPTIDSVIKTTRILSSFAYECSLTRRLLVPVEGGCQVHAVLWELNVSPIFLRWTHLYLCCSYARRDSLFLLAFQMTVFFIVTAPLTCA